ncbi:MAG TPA: DNA translocase FtsK [Elusimicrobiota bacterium]|nr:DNA translocase FtsK [Elusimicrobiota bacterium]
MWRASRRLYAKASKKSRKNSAFSSAARWLLGLCASLYFASLVYAPALSGSFGRAAHQALVRLLGLPTYFIPVFLAAVLFQYFHKDASRMRLAALGSLIALADLCVGFSLFGQWLFANPAAGGGAFGHAVEQALYGSVGGFGTLAIVLALLLLSLHLAFGIHWSRLAVQGFKTLVADYRNWQKARRDLALELKRARLEQEKALAAKTAADKAAAPAPQNSAAPEPVKPAMVIREEKSKAAARAHAPAKAPPPPAPGSPFANYQAPALDLLQPPPPSSERGKPSQEELTLAAQELEKTLKSFGVEASVSGCSPGPVITRYELSPAPGVKVSSIVSLENDIALSMKARGIRIIAPIPGKAAVGVEIPNHKPAMVVLRDILGTPILPPQAPPLSFALGLSADGEPAAVDLQKMPHLLVAGATNSGKSVALHALVMSILMRRRPDEVKFLMIDPKRLELTFYDGIPHLFDPTAPCEEAGVITSPKAAAKSLGALVKLMEKRYEKFQHMGVRNIDAYNEEADKNEMEREFFVVVIIDELADLMLVSQERVEDAIQRLTQMARAVGIHLVLATQRPSVDVITGVIKANLPARLAMQVISRVDSKVILDGVGAESLQGRGDMLYLAAGAQRPERCQGAYVSEQEIRAVVKHLKAQGKPSYPMLETMAAASSTDDLASFGVEPLEFSQALKLVLERRRVSQDLLKSQFGSSARATNLLSLLEIKEMIFKPEGSNRWEINFDRIEEYMRQYFPQVPLGNGRS